MDTKKRGFTLVELLVVITIIGILAALITVAAAGAIKKARQAQIKTELDQISMAFEHYKDKQGSYPPNCQIDDPNMTTATATPLNEAQVLTDMKRHMKSFQHSREDDNLLRAMCGLSADGSLPNAANYTQILPGGMTAGEAVVFWLGGFSSDEKYPISGEGGPSYLVTTKGAPDNNKLDPINRPGPYKFDVARLRPRLTDSNYFDPADNRFIEYTVKINGVTQIRRINFWQYVPKKSEQPYLYFDCSRHQPDINSDPPAATPPTGSNLATPVYAIKRAPESSSSTLRIQYANQDKFQILHCGVDDAWGDFTRMAIKPLQDASKDINDPNSYLLYPNGPFSGEVADTLVNFSEGTLQGSQP